MDNFIFPRETRRERVLFNRDKAVKVAEKQKKIHEKVKELEKKEMEDLIKKNGCPIKRAEKNFFDHLNKMTEERKEKYKRLNSAVLP